MSSSEPMRRELDARIKAKQREIEQKNKELEELLRQKRSLEGGESGRDRAKRQKTSESDNAQGGLQQNASHAQEVKEMRIIADFGKQMGKPMTIPSKATYKEFLKKLGHVIGWDCSDSATRELYYFGMDGDPIAVASDECYSEMLQLYQQAWAHSDDDHPWRVVVKKRTGPNDEVPIVAIPPHQGCALPTLWKQVKMLGKGAFGEVWMALKYDLTLIAVKVLELGHGRSAEKRKSSFETERTLLKDLAHDNVVKYISSKIVWDSKAMIWMEYVPGGSLENILRSCGTIEEDLARRFALQILHGLAYLHSKKVVHCDLKPGNILINEHGVVKLSDFGESLSHVEETFESKNPRGTINYIAPELLKNKKNLSGKIDVWSLGMTVFQMLTGTLPYEDLTNEFAKMRRIARMQAPPAFPDTLSPLATDFLHKCLEIDCSKRPNAAELIDHPFVQIGTAWSAFDPLPPSQSRAHLPGPAPLPDEGSQPSDFALPAPRPVDGDSYQPLQRQRTMASLPRSEEPNVYMQEGVELGRTPSAEAATGRAEAGGGEAAEERTTRTASSASVEWRYLHHESWQPYDRESAATIEEAFQAEKATVRIQVPQGEYEVTLAPKEAMKQRNVRTGYERKVLRMTRGRLARFTTVMLAVRRLSTAFAGTTVARPAQPEDVLSYVKAKVSLEEAEALSLRKHFSGASVARSTSADPATPARAPSLFDPAASALSPPDAAGALKRSNASAGSPLGLGLVRSHTLSVQAARGDEALVPAASMEEGGAHCGWTPLARLDVGNVLVQTGPASGVSIARTASHFGATGAVRPTVAQQWTVFVRSTDGHSLASLISTVTFDLHPNKAQSSQVISIGTEPFEATRWSLGSFELAVRVRLHSKDEEGKNRELTVKHWLCLSQSGGWSDTKQSTQNDTFPLTHYVLCRPLKPS